VNFDDAIQAHAAWKIKLAVYLRKPDGTLNPAEISAENRCPFGQWLYGDAKKYSSLPEYQTLITEHARFHRAAAKIAEQANAGRTMNTEEVLGGGSEFSDASLSVVKAIKNLQGKVGQA
jgi:methyl-accepting chemotaxis protein